jgi:hypothetical protein
MGPSQPKPEKETFPDPHANLMAKQQKRASQMSNEPCPGTLDQAGRAFLWLFGNLAELNLTLENAIKFC